MIDLHTHSLLSDGALLPSELARRAQEKGYKVIGITDHTDISNIECVVDALLRVCKDINKNWKIRSIPGVELTHMPLSTIKGAVKLARSKGIRLVLVHGETVSEPVIPGTNKEAILAGPDILTHPGLISFEDAKLAASKGVYLEITARSGHSLTNGHIAEASKSTGAKLVINSDAHDPGDLITRGFAEKVLIGAGLDKKEAKAVFKNSEILACHSLDIKRLI
ncbi:histidinol phosphate phosphatase domain-containing protein [Candidatus Omnitrophota bacterium]